MNTTLNDMPMVECPNCDEEFQWDDYYDVKAGSTRECENCGTELEVLSVDTSIQCRVGIRAELGKSAEPTK